MERILSPHLADVGAELSSVSRRQAAVGQNGQLPVCELFPIAVDGVAEHVPAPGRGEGLLRFGRRAPELIRPGADVVVDPGMDTVLGRPFQPEPGIRPQLHMEHTVEQGGGHGPGDGVVLGPVARSHHDGALGEMVLPHPALQDQGVECLLHLLGAGVELVQEQAVWLVPGDHPGRAEHAPPVYDLGHADNVLRGQLAAQQGHTGQANLLCKLFHDTGFPDSNSSPDEYWPYQTYVQQDVQKLFLVNGCCQVHGFLPFRRIDRRYTKR